MNLQDSFLNQVRKDNTEINLVMLDGTRLSGLVRGFDNFTVIINARGAQHLIYKHAIAQIISRRPHGEGDTPGEHAPGEGAQPQAPRGDNPRGDRQDRGDRGDRPRGDRPRQGGNPPAQATVTSDDAAPQAQAQHAPAAEPSEAPAAPEHPAAPVVIQPHPVQPQAPRVQQQQPRRDQQPPRDQRPQRERRDNREQRSGDKFNTIDFSQIKVDEKQP